MTHANDEDENELASLAAAPSEEPVAWFIDHQKPVKTDEQVEADLSGNAGLRGAAALASESLKSVASVRIGASPAVAPVAVSVKGLEDTIRWAHDTLHEINPANYDDAEVRKLNDASIEVILGLAQVLGEKHGKTDEWWAEYRSKHPRIISSIIPATKGGEDHYQVTAMMGGRRTRLVVSDGDDAYATTDRAAAERVLAEVNKLSPAYTDARIDGVAKP